MPVVELLYCVGCGCQREFEQPPCDDGHGLDCPELACVECGLAVVGSWLDSVETGRHHELLLQDVG